MQNLHFLTLVFLYASFLLLLNFSSCKTQKTDPFDHQGPVLSLPVKLYIIWYGQWTLSNKTIIRDFINSFSSPPLASRHPSVSDWWATVTLYNDQTNSNITKSITLSGEFHDSRYSNGTSLKRLSVQHVIRNAIKQKKLPLDYTNGLYLVLTSGDVGMQDFCRAACGFHSFTFQSIVGATMPYAWVGYSGSQCPEYCAYPFVLPKYPPPPKTMKKFGPPNGNIGIDAMINIIAHELAEASSNPLINTWYAGDQLAPMEIADMCSGIYGTGGVQGYSAGSVYMDPKGKYEYNLYGVRERKFLVQWVWDPVKERCYGPNAKKG
ncbi:Protein EXORDIUM-like 7 [Castilleja foliolosa]|uniref:Protein EXORDIUM-like 7 n=1 Tax=Castilleja foliolosa TaxID=1961234 RepID=A0ABD3BH40_9LAMI